MRTEHTSDMTFQSAEPRRGARPAKLIGPGEFGLSSRIDVHLHDGCDSTGAEYAELLTLVFDDETIQRAATAMGTDPAMAEKGLRAALEGFQRVPKP